MSGVQSPILDDMPTEIKLIILSQISDIRSLSAIVHASPRFHAAYNARRAEILRSVVLETLKHRGLDFAQTPHALEIYSHTASQDIFVPIVLDCYQQLVRGATNLSLTTDQSIALLRVAIAVPWIAAPDANPLFGTTFSREGSRILPDPRPAVLCRIIIRPDRHGALMKLLKLLVDEGYRISGRKINGRGDVCVGDVMTLEPYESDTPEN